MTTRAERLAQQAYWHDESSGFSADVTKRGELYAYGPLRRDRIPDFIKWLQVTFCEEEKEGRDG